MDGYHYKLILTLDHMLLSCLVEESHMACFIEPLGFTFVKHMAVSWSPSWCDKMNASAKDHSKVIRKSRKDFWKWLRDPARFLVLAQPGPHRSWAHPHGWWFLDDQTARRLQLVPWRRHHVPIRAPMSMLYMCTIYAPYVPHIMVWRREISSGTEIRKVVGDEKSSRTKALTLWQSDAIFLWYGCWTSPIPRDTKSDHRTLGEEFQLCPQKYAPVINEIIWNDLCLHAFQVANASGQTTLSAGKSSKVRASNTIGLL